MKRRAVLGVLASGAAMAQTAAAKPIELHVDLWVDNAKDQDIKRIFRDDFKPAMAKQPGYVNVHLMKLREVKAGKGPENANYRLVIGFKTEEDRVRWVKTDIHQKVWPMMESTFKAKNYNALLFDPL